MHFLSKSFLILALFLEIANNLSAMDLAPACAVKLNLVLDLDDVLLHHSNTKFTKLHTFYSKKTFIVNDSLGNNYIAPAYCSEFLKFVSHKFNISFFSNGIEERNTSAVSDIWMKVFGSCMPNDIQVLGRKSTTYAGNPEDLQPHPKGDKYRWHGEYKKDLRKIGPLSMTILVDDDKSWVLKGQEANFLCAPSAGFFDFQDIVENYSSEIESNLGDKCQAVYTLAFYKLLYIIGVLEVAAEHCEGIIPGLYAIQFIDDASNFHAVRIDLKYYKRGYRALSEFLGETLPAYFPEGEKHFK